MTIKGSKTDSLGRKPIQARDNTMKYSIFISCAAFICMFVSVAHSQERGPTVQAYVVFPPYKYQENGQPKGLLVEIVCTMSQRAGLPLELVHKPFKRAYEFPALNDFQSGAESTPCQFASD